MTDPRIEFVFGEVDNQLKRELRVFWSQHGNAYQEEMKSFRAETANNQRSMDMDLLKKPISRQPAIISRDQTGAINGIAFVLLRELETSLDLGSHAYFQRMYIIPESRRFGLTNRLFRAFLQGFDREVEKRDLGELLGVYMSHPGCSRSSAFHLSPASMFWFAGSPPPGQIQTYATAHHLYNLQEAKAPEKRVVSFHRYSNPSHVVIKTWHPSLMSSVRNLGSGTHAATGFSWGCSQASGEEQGEAYP